MGPKLQSTGSAYVAVPLPQVPLMGVMRTSENKALPHAIQLCHGYKEGM